METSSSGTSRRLSVPTISVATCSGMAYYKHAHYHAIDSGSIAKSTFYVDMQLQQDQKTESTSGKNNTEAQSHDMCEDMGQVVLCAQSKSKNQKDKHDKGAEALEQKDPGVSMGQVVGGDTTQPSGEKGGVTMGTEDKVLGVEHMEYMGGRRSSAFDRIKDVPPQSEPDYGRSMDGVVPSAHAPCAHRQAQGEDCGPLAASRAGLCSGRMEASDHRSQAAGADGREDSASMD